MNDVEEAAIEAASRAIEAMPRRDYPDMVDTSAWGTSPAKTITVSAVWADHDPTPLPLDLPAGWTTVEQMKARAA